MKISNQSGAKSQQSRTKNKKKYNKLNKTGVQSHSDSDSDDDYVRPSKKQSSSDQQEQQQVKSKSNTKMRQFYDGVNMDEVDILQLDAKQSKNIRNNNLSTDNLQQQPDADSPTSQQIHTTQLNRKLNIVILTLIVVLTASLFVHYYIQNYMIVGKGEAQVVMSVGLNQNINNQKNKDIGLSVSEPDIQKNDNKQQKVQYIPEKMAQKLTQKVAEKEDQHPVDQNGFDIKVPEPNQQRPTPPPPRQTQPTKTPTRRSQSVNQQRYSKSLNLNDFQTDAVYTTAPQQIKQIFDQMIKRPQDKRASPTAIFMPTQKAYFAYRLYLQPQNQRYLKAEYYYYQNKYQISQFQQYQFCIVAPGRNLVKNNRYRRFIDSVQRQNYTYYKLVYVDDVSQDNSAEQLQKYIKKIDGPLNKLMGSNSQYQGSFIVDPEQFNKEQDQRRTIIVKNKQRLYALANRNQAVRKYCPEQSIILDVDADDAIIGKQAFKFVNAVYHNQQVWMFNSVFIYDKSLQKQVTTGPQDGVPIQILENNRYRTSMIWKTSQLRTFKAKLFNKIDEKDFKDQNGVFYQWASDVFTQEPLVQLSGPQHYKHLYEIVYFYDWDFDRTTVFKRRHYRDIVFMQTPYLPLDSLDDEAVKKSDYITPQIIVNEYEKNIREGRLQAERYHRPPPF